MQLHVSSSEDKFILNLHLKYLLVCKYKYSTSVYRIKYNEYNDFKYIATNKTALNAINIFFPYFT